MKPCRECHREISEQAVTCPQCGAPHPARELYNGHGFEYKSAASIAGIPLIHISFRYLPNRRPVPARGVIAIGQFAAGVVCISQFGIGVVCLSQFAIAAFTIAQFAVGYSLIAQFGLYLSNGWGQRVLQLTQWFGQ